METVLAEKPIEQEEEQAEQKFEPVPEELIDKAKEVNLVTLAEKHVKLAKVSATEWAGPCPKCKGTDRFHVRIGWFFCRHCHEPRGDAIEFAQWKYDLDFRGAVELLTGEEIPETARITPAEKEKSGKTRFNAAYWLKRVEAAQRTLFFDDVAAPGRNYLLGRGIEPHTWLTFGLGYEPLMPLPNTKGQKKAPAIVMPWFVGGLNKKQDPMSAKLVAIRYRFLEKHTYIDADGKEQKDIKQTGRGPTGRRLFGGQTHPRVGQEHCTLVVCEGELNAASIWQVAHNTNVDVLSLGSESQNITVAMAKAIMQYRTVILWMDESKYVTNNMTLIPGAIGFQSPSGQDANDLLQAGKLGGVLSTLRARAAHSDSEFEALLWDLWSGAEALEGVDDGTAEVIQKLAEKLGRDVQLINPEPGRWIIPKRLYG